MQLLIIKCLDFLYFSSVRNDVRKSCWDNKKDREGIFAPSIALGIGKAVVLTASGKSLRMLVMLLLTLSFTACADQEDPGLYSQHYQHYTSTPERYLSLDFCWRGEQRPYVVVFTNLHGVEATNADRSGSCYFVRSSNDEQLGDAGLWYEGEKTPPLQGMKWKLFEQQYSGGKLVLIEHRVNDEIAEYLHSMLQDKDTVHDAWEESVLFLDESLEED